jgi:hypothetical protein
MQPDYLMLQLLSQAVSSGGGWLTAVLLLGLLVALLFRRERINNWVLFRLSCCLLAASVIVPPILNVLLNLTGSSMPITGSGAFARTSTNYAVAMFAYALSPILQGTSILCALLAMVPSCSDVEVSPPKHPLDQN